MPTRTLALRPLSESHMTNLATDDLWEVRVIFAGNIFRLLGWMEGTDKLVLAHGFTKKTEKTPLQEIQLTENRKKIYENKET